MLKKSPGWKTLLLTLPMSLGVEVPTDTTSSFQSTMLKVAGGRGDIAFVIRDCDGRTVSSGKESYTNYALDLQHNFNDIVALGVRGGYLEGFEGFLSVPVLTKGFYYFNPYISLELPYAGAGIGFFQSEFTPLAFEWDSNENSTPLTPFIAPSAHVRLGPRRIHFATSFMEGVPLYTTGYFDMGLGALTEGGHSLWFGFGFPGPYETGGVMTKLDFKLGRGFGFNFIGRVGKADDITEYGVATGLSYTIDWK